MRLFKNINTEAILSEKEYEDLLLREAKEFWEGLDEEDKSEWENDFEAYKKHCDEQDNDFEEIEIIDIKEWADEQKAKYYGIVHVEHLAYLTSCLEGFETWTVWNEKYEEDEEDMTDEEIVNKEFYLEYTIIEGQKYYYSVEEA